jgi:uracil-DNA glycosylase
MDEANRSDRSDLSLRDQINNCRICADRFAATPTRHSPRPVVWFNEAPRILIAGQAPGMRVHASGKPFDDKSGDRLRDWLGITAKVFYDRPKVAIVPMAFCFPGYDTKGADLPPPKVCQETWHDRVMQQLADVPLTIVVGGYAQRYHLGVKSGVTATVQGWRDFAPRVYPLPHPSWRNTGWLKNNPWFADELLPDLRAQVKDALQ